MTKLSVNINKVATLRNTRPNLNIPDLLHLGRIALEAGAHGLTIHPRPDERHIRGTDVEPIARVVAAFPGREFNIEGNPFHGDYMAHCRKTKPTQATLVPDSESQSTSDHGWDLRRDGDAVQPIIAELKSLGCRVSLFMDADPTTIPLARDVGADRIELYTEPFASAFERSEHGIIRAYAETARAAAACGLGINAGHDLNLHNLAYFVENVPEVEEVSIGHALIADAIEHGLAMTVRHYLAALRVG